MKTQIRIVGCILLLVLSLLGCSSNATTSETKKTNTEVIEDDINKDTMIDETRESLAIFVNLLGTESEDGNIAVTDEFLENVENVYIMGRNGAVAHGFGDDVQTVISIMEWTDNNSASETEFDNFITLLNDYFGETGQVKSYENYSDETYVWKDYDNTSYVLCWYSDSITKLSWHYDETLMQEKSNDVIGKVEFTNQYGTATTKCAHSGCENYIASSGDTNCCTQHSNKCLECNKYIDEDALYCLDCIEKAANEIKTEKHICEECSDEGIYSMTGLSGKTEYYCYKHYKELEDMMEKILGN